jgi:tetratricopeptide (TPR) repeat protein
MPDADERVAALLAEADALIGVKRYGDAAERAQAAVGLAPQDPRPFCELSRARYGEGEYAEAAVMADEAIRLAPEYRRGFLLRSMALRSVAGQSSGGHRAALGHEAVTSAQEAVRLAPWDPNGHIALAQALPLTGAIAQADAAIQDAIRLAPDSASTWAAASRVALAAKNWSAAIAASHRSLAIDPNNYAALNNLGVALRASGKGREGTRVLARAAQLQPDSPTARRNLTRAGLNVMRVVILIVLIPVGFFAHVGFGLYVIFAIGTNVLLAKSSGLVLRLERWGVPIALFLARRTPRASRGLSAPPSAPPPSPIPDRVGRHAAVERPSIPPWSAVRGAHAVGIWVLWVMAAAVWCLPALFLVLLFMPMPGKPGFAVALVATIALAAWPTHLVIRRRRADR